MKAFPTTAIVAGLIAAVPAVSHATNGYQLIGVGAYQKSLAGAITANPGSAMTAVSNPAGAARVGSRADFSMEAFMPKRSVGFNAMGGTSADSVSELYGVPAIGWTAPVADGSDLYFGGGMYGTSGMGVDYAPTRMAPGYYADPSVPSSFVADPVYWDGYSNISFWQMAPVLAKNINSQLSVGASLNIDYQSVAFKQRAMADTNSDGAGDSVLSNFDLSRGASGFGLGASIGFLFDINELITVGASYKSTQYFNDLKFQLAQGDISHPMFGGDLPAGTYKLDLDFPQQMALGIAVHATDTLTVSADVKRINWADTMDKLAVKGPGGIVFPMDPGWDDQIVYAIGIAYSLSPSVNLRAGFNYAKAPFDADMVSHNLILPAVVETHYTFGADFALNNHWELAMHYMYVPENTITAPVTDTMAPGASVSLSETSMGMNIGYRF